MTRSIVIISAARTPMGGFQGALSGMTAPQLGAVAIRTALDRAPVELPVDEVLMGCVLPAGQGQAPARQAALAAGLGYDVPATTINKMCGSGMKAVMMARDAILADPTRIIVAGGMESMSNAPYLLDRARGGYRMGHGRVLDHMFMDGLEDAYDRSSDGGGRLMGTFAEDCAENLNLSRADQDAFAMTSLSRGKASIAEGRFRAEIAPVTIPGKSGTTIVDADEQPDLARPDKIPQLKPAFRAGGTVTAANSSSISDGAAAVVVMAEDRARALGLTPLARIVGQTSFAAAPNLFPTAPIGAMQKLFQQIGWTPQDVDLYEINEAFAVVTLAATRALGLDPERVNVNGGACALGHPIGASGARVLVTLIHALRARGLRRGMASLCIGGGEATAMAVEIMG